jgi:hypothetical protein
LDAAAVNAWCLHQKFWEQENPGKSFKEANPMKRVDFQKELFESLAGLKKRKRPAIDRRNSCDSDTLICPFVEAEDIHPNRPHWPYVINSR